MRHLRLDPNELVHEPANPVRGRRFVVKRERVVQVSVPISGPKHKAHIGDDAPWAETTVESLPEKYHSKSELTFDVQAGSNTKDWDLAVKK